MVDEHEQQDERVAEADPASNEGDAPKAKKGSRRGGNGRSEEAAPRAPAAPPRMKLRYRNEIAPALMQEFSYQNVMAVPRITKVVLNIGLGEATENANVLDTAAEEIGVITGQKAVITRAKRPIANFKIRRRGSPIGVMVTIRGNRMWEFLDRLVNASLPRIRDFHGVPPEAFDGRGNYSLGIREQLIFPEIEYDKVDRIRGMQINIITSARNDEEGKRLLELLGMPFSKN
jgi:large subunit ribosomal protein L5